MQDQRHHEKCWRDAFHSSARTLWRHPFYWDDFSPIQAFHASNLRLLEVQVCNCRMMGLLQRRRARGGGGSELNSCYSSCFWRGGENELASQNVRGNLPGTWYDILIWFWRSTNCNFWNTQLLICKFGRVTELYAKNISSYFVEKSSKRERTVKVVKSQFLLAKWRVELRFGKKSHFFGSYIHYWR